MKIIKGKTKPKGLRIVVYGPHGLGKTTLASKLPDALFFDYENGTHGIDVAKVDESDLPRSYAAVRGALDELKRNPQGFKNLVIDSADKLEEALDKTFSAEKGIESVFAVNDYGRTIAGHKQQMAAIIDKAADLANAGVNVIWIAHETPRKVEVLEGQGAYDHHEMKLSKTVTPLFMESADVVIFCSYKTFMVAANKQAGETKGHVEGGKRWCWTTPHNEWDAKHRACIELPDDCSLDKMAELLPKALAAATSRSESVAVVEAKQATVSAPAPTPKAEDSHSSDKPALAELRRLLGNYGVSEDQIRTFADAQPKLKGRYGTDFSFATARMADWPDEALQWLSRNMEKIAAKIKDN